MKKSILFSVLCVMLLAASSAKANTLADGVWFIPATGNFCSANINGDEIISICWNSITGEGSWVRGFFTANVATFLGGSGVSALREVVTITSPTTAVGVIHICVATPGFFCRFTAGTTFTLEKIF